MDATQQSTPPPGDPLIDLAVTAFNDGCRAYGTVHDRVELQAAQRAGVAAVVAFMNDRTTNASRNLKAVA